MAGLQGAGKTTTVGKLARFLKERKKKSVLVVSADVYRPAASKQLEMLAAEVGVTCFPSDPGQQPVESAHAAIRADRKSLVTGQSVSVRVDDGGGRVRKQKHTLQQN